MREQSRWNKAEVAIAKRATKPLMWFVFKFLKTSAWANRQFAYDATDRMAETNPEFGAGMMRHYVRTLPTKIWRRTKYRASEGNWPMNSIVLGQGDGCYRKEQCDGCVTADLRKTGTTMTKEFLDDAITQLWGVGGRAIYPMGGEPLRGKSSDLLLHAIRTHPHMFFGIFTGGDVREEHIEAAWENKNAIFIVSANGVGPKYEWKRGCGSFGEAEASMKLLRENRVPYVVSSVVMQDNHEHLSSPEFVEHFDNLGAGAVFYLGYIPTNGVHEGKLLTDAQQEHFAERVVERQQYTSMLLMNYAQMTKLLKCRAVTNHMYLHSTGEMTPCFVVGNSFGNLHETPMREIISSEAAKDFLEFRKRKGKHLCVAMGAPKEVREHAEKYSLPSISNAMEHLERVYDERHGVP